jgi:3-phenylpropionate/trans-cinnamate dioxygenase ferredoxin reductase subunit
MADTETFVIVGGGLAAAKAAEGLRHGGFEGHVVLVSDEHHLPHERPPLSKGYLLGTEALESAVVHPREWYVEQDVDLRLGAPARTVDVDAHTVTVGQEQIGFDRLLIATGATARRLPVVQNAEAPVTYLRTIEDSQRIRAALQPGRGVAVIGGGWIGLEVAAAARAAGCEVVIIEALEAPLVRVLGPEVARVFADLHRSHGVDLRTNVSVTSVEADAGRAVVRLGNGATLAADLVVVGVGATPSTALAEAAGLKVDNGIVVDEYLRTSHPDVFAAGDVANAYHPKLGRHVRVEHWDNAIAQGLAAARNMLGAGEPYDRLPYFFTDQYDLGMEYVGSIGPAGYDEVVLRGDVEGRTFTALWLKDGTVLAGTHVNDWDAIEPIRQIVGAGGADLARLRDPGVPLAQLTK